MRCVLLAAGYATRLFPLTKDLPKSLLSIAGKTILEHLITKIREVREIDEIVLVTNDRFVGQFRSFLQCLDDSGILVVNDGTRDNEHRLGAIGDVAIAVRAGNINDDLMVLAGDNLFDFSLVNFVDFFHSSGTDCVTAYAESRVDALRRTGVAEIDALGRVLSFEEKPINPRFNDAVPPFYIYRKETVGLLDRYLLEGNDPDAPGRFIAWLVNKYPVSAFRFSGRRYDIGTLESYKEAQDVYAQL